MHIILQSYHCKREAHHWGTKVNLEIMLQDGQVEEFMNLISKNRIMNVQPIEESKLEGDQKLSNFKITNLADPIPANDQVTINCDNATLELPNSGVRWKDPIDELRSQVKGFNLR